jgi:hypothetical protein
MFKVYGENTLTGNAWLCETVATQAEAEETCRGYKRLEADYKIAYFIEFDEDAK